MRIKIFAGTLFLVGILALALVAGASAGSPACENRTNNSVDKLLECVTLEGVREHQAALQAIADANGGIRTSGTPGYDASVNYVVERMTAAGYNVTVQTFDFFFVGDRTPPILEQISPNPATYVDGVDFATMDYSGSGDVTAPLTAVDLIVPSPAPNASTSGCEAADFAGFTAGHIALMQRGTCTFRLKAENAQAAGAVGVIVFNEGNPGRTAVLFGTLGSPPMTLPAVGTSFALGDTFRNGVLNGPTGVTVRIRTDTLADIRSTSNVFAETQNGDPNHVIMAGAHLDSVTAGPGINDNGSGSAALLEIAEEMAKVKPRNLVRFAWWGAEEFGLVGSTYYVDNLSDAERDEIALYLNFDMVGSPNHVFFIYDGDDSDAQGSGPGPEGSAHVEDAFEAYFTAVDIPFKGTDFTGRSDYGPFILAGIPAGGLFTGAEGVKTAQEAAIWGGTAGQPYDPCYHLACDTYGNVNLSALDTNADAIAFATLQFAMNLEGITGEHGKGNFDPDRWGSLNIK